MGGAVGGGGEGHRVACQVEDGSPHAFGAEIDAEEVGVFSHGGSLNLVLSSRARPTAAGG